MDVENFKFTPRIQKLNELEVSLRRVYFNFLIFHNLMQTSNTMPFSSKALSRVKLNFIDQLTKFWRLQGISLKLPMLDGKFVDLYTLQKVKLFIKIFISLKDIYALIYLFYDINQQLFHL